MTKNLGLVKAIHVGTTPPLNTILLWFDTNVGQMILKYYNINSSTWTIFSTSTLSSDAITNESNVDSGNGSVSDAMNWLLNNKVAYSQTSTATMQFVIDEDNMSSNSDTKVPTQQSVKAYVDGALVGAVTYQGGYNASTNSPNLVTPVGVQTGYMYAVTTPGTAFFGESLEPGDVMIAEVNNPTLLTDWTIINKNIVSVDDSMYIWVDGGAAGNDTSGDGSKAKPYKTIKKGILMCPANGVVMCRKYDYQEPCMSWSDNTIADNVTIFGEPGCSLRGPNRNDTAYGPSFAFNKRFIYHLNQGKTFNIKGYFDIKGDFGFVSTEHVDAVMNWEVNTFKLDAVTGAMNIRAHSGYMNGVVKSEDMIIQDQQGIFIGPGGGALDLNVVNGKIIMKKTNLTHASNQTRLFQINSASTTRRMTIQCNGIQTIVDPDHSFTEFLDPIHMSSLGTTVTFELRGGNIVDTSVPVDGDFTKRAGQDGMVINNGGGTCIINGGIITAASNGIHCLTSINFQVIVNGDIFSAYKSAVWANNTHATARIDLKGFVFSNGLKPTVIHSGNQKLFLSKGIKNNSTLVQNAIGILYNGSGLVLNPGVVIQTSGISITTDVASRVYKLNGDILINKDIPSSPVSKVIRMTINKVVDNQVYTIVVNGINYTYSSGVSATNLTIAAGLVAAIGIPSGVSSVVNNGNGTFDITATAGTDLTAVDGTTWTTVYKWEIIRSAVEAGNPWTLTINGTPFTFTSSDTSYYHETGGGIPDIRDNMKALIQANGTINSLIGTYQLDKFGLTLICASGQVLTSAVGSGNSLGYVPEPQMPILSEIINNGYLGGMTNAIGGTSFVYDPDVEI